MKRLITFSSLVILLLLLGATSTQLSAAENAADSVSVMDPYVRAVPRGQPNSAAFMKLQNSSANDHAIVSAESSASEIVELHIHIEEGGMMKMRQIEKIDIPAQGETVLKPGGLHVMLIGLNEELKEGDGISLTLVFADGSNKEIQVPVRKIAMQMQGHQNDE